MLELRYAKLGGEDLHFYLSVPPVHLLCAGDTDGVCGPPTQSLGYRSPGKRLWPWMSNPQCLSHHSWILKYSKNSEVVTHGLNQPES